MVIDAQLIHKTKKIGAWRSLVAHLLWEQGVGGSNPLAPTRNDSSGIFSKEIE